MIWPMAQHGDACLHLPVSVESRLCRPVGAGESWLHRWLVHAGESRLRRLMKQPMTQHGDARLSLPVSVESRLCRPVGADESRLRRREPSTPARAGESRREPARAGESRREPARAGESRREPARAGYAGESRREPARAGYAGESRREPARAGFAGWWYSRWHNRVAPVWSVMDMRDNLKTIVVVFIFNITTDHVVILRTSPMCIQIYSLYQFHHETAGCIFNSTLKSMLFLNFSWSAVINEFSDHGTPASSTFIF